MIVLNLFGAPGAGKSTAMAYIFSQLKMNGIKVEMSAEFAKDLVYEGSDEPFNNQLYILGEQSYRLSKLKDKVDIVVTDAPLVASIHFKDCSMPASFDQLVMDIFNSYTNINYYLERDFPYQKDGRFETEAMADAASDDYLNIFRKYLIPYKKIKSSVCSYDLIVKEILELLEALNND